jgi:ligand-binding sensor domain-containing protein
MKTRANQVSLSVTLQTHVNWGAEIQAGDPDKNITSLTSAAGTAYVGREDGLFVYNMKTNLFTDVEPDANFFASAKNFKAAIGRGGAIWASGGEQTFWTASPTGQGDYHDWENLTHLVQSNAYNGFGGHVAALAQDRANVWVALSDNSISESQQFDYNFPFSFVTSGVSSCSTYIYQEHECFR